MLSKIFKCFLLWVAVVGFSLLLPTYSYAHGGCTYCQQTGLHKGINLFDWFMGPDIYNRSPASYISTSKIHELRRMGFNHVRLPVYGKFIADLSTTKPVLNSTQIGYLDQAIHQLISHGLAVVLVLNPEDDMQRLATNDNAKVAYSNLWKLLAQRYKKYSTNSIYFELINEPHFQAFLADSDARTHWSLVQQSILSAIRSETIHHYAIIANYDWDSVSGMPQITNTVSDPKVIYTAHFYDPIAFTAQGIPSFGDPNIRSAHNLPYPVQQAPCLNALAALSPIVAQNLNYYCYSNFDREHIIQEFQQFAAWANTHHVPIYLGEFGTHADAAPPGNGVQWLTDVHEVAKSYGIPWAYWAYNDPDYAITDSTGNFRPDIVKALGLL